MRLLRGFLRFPMRLSFAWLTTRSGLICMHDVLQNNWITKSAAIAMASCLRLWITLIVLEVIGLSGLSISSSSINTLESPSGANARIWSNSITHCIQTRTNNNTHLFYELSTSSVSFNFINTLPRKSSNIFLI